MFFVVTDRLRSSLFLDVLVQRILRLWSAASIDGGQHFAHQHVQFRQWRIISQNRSGCWLRFGHAALATWLPRQGFFVPFLSQNIQNDPFLFRGVVRWEEIWFEKVGNVLSVGEEPYATVTFRGWHFFRRLCNRNSVYSLDIFLDQCFRQSHKQAAIWQLHFYTLRFDVGRHDFSFAVRGDNDISHDS